MAPLTPHKRGVLPALLLAAAQITIPVDAAAPVMFAKDEFVGMRLNKAFFAIETDDPRQVYLWVAWCPSRPPCAASTKLSHLP